LEAQVADIWMGRDSVERPDEWQPRRDEQAESTRLHDRARSESVDSRRKRRVFLLAL